MKAVTILHVFKTFSRLWKKARFLKILKLRIKTQDSRFHENSKYIENRILWFLHLDERGGLSKNSTWSKS